MLEVLEIRCFPPQVIQGGTRKVQITQIKECNKETLRKSLREQFMKMLVQRSGKDVRNSRYKGLNKIFLLFTLTAIATVREFLKKKVLTVIHYFKHHRPNKILSYYYCEMLFRIKLLVSLLLFCHSKFKPFFGNTTKVRVGCKPKRFVSLF